MTELLSHQQLKLRQDHFDVVERRPSVVLAHSCSPGAKSGV